MAGDSSSVSSGTETMAPCFAFTRRGQPTQSRFDERRRNENEDRRYSIRTRRDDIHCLRLRPGASGIRRGLHKDEPLDWPRTAWVRVPPRRKAQGPKHAAALDHCPSLQRTVSIPKAERRSRVGWGTAL